LLEDAESQGGKLDKGMRTTWISSVSGQTGSPCNWLFQDFLLYPKFCNGQLTRQVGLFLKHSRPMLLITVERRSHFAWLYHEMIRLDDGNRCRNREMFTALFISDQFSLRQVARFIGLAITGNLIGGSIFVALLNYGHIRKTQQI